MKQTLINKYLAGTSTHEEEELLLQLLKAEESLPAEEQMLVDMLSMTGQEMEGQEAWMEEDESELFDRMMAKMNHEEEHNVKEAGGNISTPAQPPRRLKVIALRILASAALLTGAFYASRTIWQPAQDDMAVTYIYGNRVENTEMAMDMMHKTLSDIFDRPDIESELADLLN